MPTSMTMAHSDRRSPRNSQPVCLLRLVAQSMESEPTLDAVQFDRNQKTLSFATLGRSDQPGRVDRLAQQWKGLNPAQGDCTLLQTGSPCQRCPYQPAAASPGAPLQVSHDDTTLTIARIRCPTAPRFWRWSRVPWPKLVPRSTLEPGAQHGETEWKFQLAAAALCGLLALAGAFIQPPGISTALFVLSYLAGGWFPAQEVWERLQQRVLDVHFLMLTVAAGSAAIGAWEEGATLLFLFSFSGALEHYAMGRTQREIKALFHAAPKEAIVMDPQTGAETTVPVDALQSGARLLVKPGQLFPVDAEISSGATAADESNLTGESTPIHKNVGDLALGGTLNLWGAVEAVVLRPASQSSLQRMIDLIHQAQHLKAPSQRFTDRFGTPYTYAILALSLGLFLFAWLVLGHPPFVGQDARPSAFYRAMTLLVVASPCALVLSIPSAILAAIAWSARRGILFRGGAAVEKLAEVRVVAMDKTGTLTTGDLRVESIESAPPGQEHRVAQLAYSLDRLSTHPLARAITRHGKMHGLTTLPIQRVESVPGEGIQGDLEGHPLRLGRRTWIEGFLAAPLPLEASRSTPDLSEVWLHHRDLTGRIVLRDDIRPAAKAVVKQLADLGLTPVVLTGDRQDAADHLRGQLGLVDIRAGLAPAQKLDAVHSFSAAGKPAAMIGDGVNDAPSLAAAHVGVAMGARGSDATLEQADVVLMHDRLENFLAAYRLSQAARRIIRQNLIISISVAGTLMVAALIGSIPLTLGVIGHEGSTVVVVLNSLRLLFLRTPSSQV